MVTPHNILRLFEQHGVPQKGIPLTFLPSDTLIEQLTRRFQIEFAIMFTVESNNYFIYAGNHNSVELPIDASEILLKHTHPRGTAYPSQDDIDWLIMARSLGSPQIQSVILPIGKKRITFRTTTLTYETP